jgi:pimeloyl-ACP methyl ester carboxylesterase
VAAVSGPGLWFYRGSANMRTLHRLVLSRSGRTLLRLVRGTRVSPVRWTEPYPLDPRAAAAAVTVPLLIVHGDRDDYFPAHHAWQIHRSAPESTLWMEAGFGHAEGAVTEDLAQRMADWLAEHARPAHDTTDGGS